MSLFVPKSKRPGKSYSVVLDTGSGTTYLDTSATASVHVAEWDTPLGCIQKPSICILEQVTLDTNATISNPVYSNMFAVRLVGGGSPDSFDSTRNGPDNCLMLSGIPFVRVGYVPDGVVVVSPPITVTPRSRNGVVCGPGFNLQTIRIALEEYDSVRGVNASQISRIV